MYRSVSVVMWSRAFPSASGYTVQDGSQLGQKTTEEKGLKIILSWRLLQIDVWVVDWVHIAKHAYINKKHSQCNGTSPQSMGESFRRGSKFRAGGVSHGTNLLWGLFPLRKFSYVHAFGRDIVTSKIYKNICVPWAFIFFFLYSFVCWAERSWVGHRSQHSSLL